MIEYQIGALPRTPFPASRDFAPVGSMSLDSRVVGLPYESSSFATPAVQLVNQKEGPFMGRLRAYFDQLAHPMQDVHSGTITRAYCRAIYEESASRCFILPPLAGEVRRSRIGGRRAQRANQQNAYHAIWYSKVIP